MDKSSNVEPSTTEKSVAEFDRQRLSTEVKKIQIEAPSENPYENILLEEEFRQKQQELRKQREEFKQQKEQLRRQQQEFHSERQKFQQQIRNRERSSSCLDDVVRPSNITQQTNQPKFDEKLLRCATEIKNHIRLSWNRNGIYINDEMFNHVPLLQEMSFPHGNLDMKTLGCKGIEKLSELFPLGLPVNRLNSIIGEAGSGKSVCLKLLRNFFYQRGYFPVLISFKTSYNKQKTCFARFVASYGCPWYPISDIEGFLDWLDKIFKRIIFLLDDLDTASFNLGTAFETVNIHEAQSVEVWINLLLSGQIMRESRIIFTSRPSNLLGLPILQRPLVTYKLNGFTDENLVHAVDVHNQKLGSEVVDFIKSKTSGHMSFLRSPFVVSLICMTYSVFNADNHQQRTLAKVYSLALEQRRGSRPPREEIGIEELVDQFYLKMWKCGKNTFTTADATECSLTIEVIENNSFVKITPTNKEEVKPAETFFHSHHESNMAYHVARALIRNTSLEDFKIFVKNLFLSKEFRNVVVRRFLCGFINDSDWNEEFMMEKAHMFLDEFVRDLKKVTTKIWTLKGEELVQAHKMQNHLMYDLQEFISNTEAMKYIKKHLPSGLDLNLLIDLQTGISLGGATNLLRRFDPHLRNLTLVFTGDIVNERFPKFVDAMKSLSRKVGRISISNIPYLVDELNKLHAIVEERLLLHFKDDVHEVENIKDKLQHELDHHSYLRMFVQVQHRHRAHLLRHKSYTSLTSSPILMSHHVGSNKTINLKSCQKDDGEVKSEIIQEIKENQFKFDFLISQQEEVEMLGKMIISIPDINLNFVQIFLTPHSTKSCMKTFCECFNKINKKVNGFILFNGTLELIGIEEITILVRNTEHYLRLDYLDEVSEDEKNEFGRKLASVWHLKPPTLNIDISFKK